MMGAMPSNMGGLPPAAVPTNYAAGLPPGKVVDRDPPDVPASRAELVKDWLQKIDEAMAHWKDTFAEMKDCSKFSAGKQWPNHKKKEDRYVANITLRHINQRVSSIYAKNPRVRAERMEKIWYQVWDGTPEMLAQANMAIAVDKQLKDPKVQEAIAAGLMQAPPQTMLPALAMQVIAEAANIAKEKELATRRGRTLELVAQYSLDEPQPRFKIQAKQLVRRVLTCKAGYIKLGYQRIMEPTPDVSAKIKDASDRIAHLESLAADLADDVITPESKEAEELKLNLDALQAQPEIVLREGMMFSFPKAWSIIIDPNCTQLKGFIGAEWIAELYVFTPRQVQKIYGIDVGKNFTAYKIDGRAETKTKRESVSHCSVYEVYDLVGQVAFTLISGYKDFVKDPGEPDVTLEQFHPYFSLSFNDTEESETIFPPSDVELIRPMAVEYNRAREGLRDHRWANRPATVIAKGVLEADVLLDFASHPNNALIETNLSKSDDINKVLVAKPIVPIDPAAYDTEHCFMDIQRVVGGQSADFGGTAGASATEVAVADASRVSTLQSNIDDLDEFLTDVMRAMGQILFLEMSLETAKEIAGPGASWSEMSRTDAAKEMILSVKAGSSGRPNKAARLAAIEKLGPLLMQMPGIDPEKISGFMLQELDENLDIDDFKKSGQPSVVAANAQAKPNLAGQVSGPGQAPAGAMNTPAPEQSGAQTQNMNPNPAAQTPGATP
jgi:hypothetical protein